MHHRHHRHHLERSLEHVNPSLRQERKKGKREIMQDLRHEGGGLGKDKNPMNIRRTPQAP